jgi:heme/copper-type cytochrome/quinol oxidase subunit 2
MVVVFRLVYFCAALLASAAGALVILSLFIQDRAPHSTGMLGIHLTVGAIFLGVAVLVLGIQRHLAGVAAVAYGQDGERAQDLVAHLNRLLAYLLVGGAFLCAVLGIMTYGILTRIDEGFAVFG